jgi:hypothetical protein
MARGRAMSSFKPMIDRARQDQMKQDKVVNLKLSFMERDKKEICRISADAKQPRKLSS